MEYTLEDHQLYLFAEDLPNEFLKSNHCGALGFDEKGRQIAWLGVEANIEYEVEDNSFDYAGTHCTGGMDGTHDPGGSIEIESVVCTCVYDEEGEPLNPNSPEFDYEEICKLVEESLKDEYQNGKGSEDLFEDFKKHCESAQLEHEINNAESREEY